MNLYLDLPMLLLLFTIIFVVVYFAYRLGFHRGGKMVFDYCTKAINDKVKELEEMSKKEEN